MCFVLALQVLLKLATKKSGPKSFLLLLTKKSSHLLYTSPYLRDQEFFLTGLDALSHVAQTWPLSRIVSEQKDDFTESLAEGLFI